MDTVNMSMDFDCGNYRQCPWNPWTVSMESMDSVHVRRWYSPWTISLPPSVFPWNSVPILHGNTFHATFHGIHGQSTAGQVC